MLHALGLDQAAEPDGFPGAELAFGGLGRAVEEHECVIECLEHEGRRDSQDHASCEEADETLMLAGQRVRLRGEACSASSRRARIDWRARRLAATRSPRIRPVIAYADQT